LYQSHVTCSAYTWYWITWNNGYFEFGLGNQTGNNRQYIYNDIAPVPINYMAVASVGSNSSWIIPGEFYTTGKIHLHLVIEINN